MTSRPVLDTLEILAPVDGRFGAILTDDACRFVAELCRKFEGRRSELLAARTQRQRGFGDFYGFVLVAQGSGELMVEHGVHVWDVAAIKPLIEEAGGRFSDWDGNPDIHRPDVIVSNGKLHDMALTILRGDRGEH